MIVRGADPDAIRAARKSAGWRRVDLADELGVRYNTLAEWEQGVAEPRRSNLKLLAIVLRVDVNDLMCDWEVEEAG